MANANTPEFDFDDENLGPKALRDFAKAQAKQNDALQKQLKTIAGTPACMKLAWSLPPPDWPDSVL